MGQQEYENAIELAKRQVEANREMGQLDCSVRTLAISIANEFTNNFLSTRGFANHHGITEEQAELLITACQDIRNTKHPDM